MTVSSQDPSQDGSLEFMSPHCLAQEYQQLLVPFAAVPAVNAGVNNSRPIDT